MSKKYFKKRQWVSVIYPESLPTNWLEIIKESGLEIALSPLHDKDLNSDDTEKKAHYHIMILYNGPVTEHNVNSFVVDKLNGAHAQPCGNVKSYYRYFTHKDNPEKYQYNEKDIKVFNGFSIINYVELSKAELIKIRKELFELIEVKSFDEYANLLEYLRINELDEMFDYACTHTILFTALFKSIRHRKGVNYEH